MHIKKLLFQVSYYTDMFEAQQPYLPVCLMTAAVMGTEYYYHLYSIRRLRDEFMHNKLGFAGFSMSKLYYGISDLTSETVYNNTVIKLFVRHMIVRPIGFICRKLI